MTIWSPVSRILKRYLEPTQPCRGIQWKEVRAIRIVLDITRLVKEGKLTPQEAERLQAQPGNKLGGCHDAGGNLIAANVMVAGPELTSGAL